MAAFELSYSLVIFLIFVNAPAAPVLVTLGPQVNPTLAVSSLDTALEMVELGDTFGGGVHNFLKSSCFATQYLLGLFGFGPQLGLFQMKNYTINRD